MFYVSLLAAVGVCGLIAVLTLGFERALTYALILTLALFPLTLLGTVPQDVGRSGISGFSMRLEAYTPVIVALAVAGLLTVGWRRLQLNVYLPLALYLIIGVSLIWKGTSEQQAGALHLLTAILAWAAGSYLAQLPGQLERTERWLLWGTGAAVLLQLLVVLAQVAGADVFPQEATAELYEGYRANGTFVHPSVLGKVFVLLLVVVLPITQSESRSVRRWAIAVVTAMAPCFVFTGSRTNFLAYVLAILLWAAMSPSTRLSRKLAVPVGVGGLILVSIDIWIERFARGEDGSARAHMNEVALEQLSRVPVFGVGPNSYVTATAPYDALTAQGWPVHNVFLLVAVELGLLGALLFFGPMVGLFMRAVRSARRKSTDGRYARALIATAPAVVAICLTGWGLMTTTLSLWLFVYGFSSKLLEASRAGTRLDVAVVQPQVTPSHDPQRSQYGDSHGARAGVDS